MFIIQQQQLRSASQESQKKEEPNDTTRCRDNERVTSLSPSRGSSSKEDQMFEEESPDWRSDGVDPVCTEISCIRTSHKPVSGFSGSVRGGQ
ncbi:hypothetical protein CgunFtcFv8_011171 [Champsocephalus gunnari]|uniref:Uncharacterized protein n=1 Tax=Champsocephalus gunnari TaxID=52237 RepID=A0AAN8DX57_CHAGU|nr:hypothetical protein CgunFtcFv8_011171 [Champsocephalus gunnari]